MDFIIPEEIAHVRTDLEMNLWLVMNHVNASLVM
jgi:hypothetical protein